MEIIFKKIELNEKDKVLMLFKKAAEKISKINVDHWQYWKNPPIEKIKWVEEGLLNNEFFFINNIDGNNIGMVRILNEDFLYWGKQEERAIYVHSLVVKEEYEGNSLGKLILQTIEADAKSKNYKYLRLDADSKNPKLCNYYLKLGFQKIGEKELSLSIYNLYQKELV